MKYCSRPFDYLLVEEGGDIYLCPWMKRLQKETCIGNLVNDDIDSCYNSTFANELRASIEEQTFSFCRSDACPFLQNNDLEEISLEEFNLRKLNSYYPTQINIAFDYTCNQYCETCRKSALTSPSINVEISEIILKNITPYLNTAKFITTSGNGEFLVQKKIMSMLENLRPTNQNLHLLLETNGVFFDEEHWVQFKHLSKFNLEVVVTINSFNKFTYNHINRGGNYKKLHDNLVFISQLRNKGELSKIISSLVMQDRNFREIPSFINTSFERYAFDAVMLKPVYQWGTMDDEVYWFKDVLNPLHPYHNEYLEIMCDPILTDPRVYNFAGDSVHEARPYPSALSANYLFPYDLVNRNSNVVIYGSGRVGREFVRQISLNNFCNVVLWVDKAHDNESIFPPDKLRDMTQDSYDYIVLATISKTFAEEMSYSLINMGIPKERIISSINEDYC